MMLPRNICFGPSALHRFPKHTWGDASLAPGCYVAGPLALSQTHGTDFMTTVTIDPEFRFFRLEEIGIHVKIVAGLLSFLSVVMWNRLDGKRCRIPMRPTYEPHPVLSFCLSSKEEFFLIPCPRHSRIARCPVAE